MSRPKFTDLPPERRLDFGNGVGPSWFPAGFRLFVTQKCSWFFEDASWRHHDFGYAVGGDEFDRWRCDWKFFMAMCKDSMSQPSRVRVSTVPVALLISLVFFVAVLFVGWRGSFRYDSRYAKLEEIVDGDPKCMETGNSP